MWDRIYGENVLEGRSIHLERPLRGPPLSLSKACWVICPDIRSHGTIPLVYRNQAVPKPTCRERLVTASSIFGFPVQKGGPGKAWSALERDCRKTRETLIYCSLGVRHDLLRVNRLLSLFVSYCVLMSASMSVTIAVLC